MNTFRKTHCLPARVTLALALLLASVTAQARDWYSAGHGFVTTRAFVVEINTADVQALLPAPLALAGDFPGKQAATHPVIFLFSTVMPRKAQLMPIWIDMPYEEFAVFIPEVTHPDLKGVFIHATILYLDSRVAVWIGQWPYRFPKTHSVITRNEGTRDGEYKVLDAQESAVPLLSLDYTLSAPENLDALLPQLKRLDDWFSLPLLNGTKKFTCSRMDWEITNHAHLAQVRGTFTAQDSWLAGARHLPPFTQALDGIKLETLWYLSMPFDCDRYRAPRQRN